MEKEKSLEKPLNSKGLSGWFPFYYKVPTAVFFKALEYLA